jgi:lauroyl/myristoyl acyltransferase
VEPFAAILANSIGGDRSTFGGGVLGVRPPSRDLKSRAKVALERTIPIGLLWYVFWPLSAIRAANSMREASAAYPGQLPTAEDSAAKRTGFLRRWQYQFELRHREVPLWYTNRMGDPRWRKRFAVDGFDGLIDLARRGPVIVASLHTISCVLLPSWIRGHGITVASVVASEGWLSSQQAARGVLAQPTGERTLFTLGETRPLIRFLESGHCVVLVSDHGVGRTITVPWRNMAVELSTGAFRLGQATGAKVVPVTLTRRGRWKYRVHVGAPVPDSMLESADWPGAAAHTLNELMPAVEAAPREADSTLVLAVRPSHAQSATT